MGSLASIRVFARRRGCAGHRCVVIGLASVLLGERDGGSPGLCSCGSPAAAVSVE
jgi:hypothetical protein